MKLMSNNPKKRAGLLGYGLEIVETVAIEMEPNPHNKNTWLQKEISLGMRF